MTFISKYYIIGMAGSSEDKKNSQRVVALFWLSFNFLILIFILTDIISHYTNFDFTIVFRQNRFILKLFIITEMCIVYYVLSLIYTKEKTNLLLSEFSCSPKMKVRLSLIYVFTPFIIIITYLIVRNLLF